MPSGQACHAHLLKTLSAVRAQAEAQSDHWAAHSWPQLQRKVLAWPPMALHHWGCGALLRHCCAELWVAGRVQRLPLAPADACHGQVARRWRSVRGAGGQAELAAADSWPWPHLAASAVSCAGQTPAGCPKVTESAPCCLTDSCR